MFPHISFLYIIGPALILVLIFGAIAKGRTKTSDDGLEKSIADLKITVIQLVILLVLLYISLPSTPSLYTFYPEDINSINTNEKVLQHLQKYNRAIVRTTEVLHYTLFLIIWGLLASVFGIIKAYKIYKHKLIN